MPQLSVPIINIGPLGQVVKQGSAMGDVPKYDTTTWGSTCGACLRQRR
jgi:hypothetical protein